MKTYVFLSLAIVVLLCATAPPSYAVPAQMTIEVVPSLGPSGYTTPSGSWATYRANAISALQDDLSTAGTIGTPGLYEVLDPWQVVPTDMLMTYSSQHSWRGDFNPTGLFAGEYGNKLYFGLKIVATAGSKVKLDDVRYHLWSTDIGVGSPFFDLSYTYAGGNYTTSRVGILNGVLITSGPATQEVDAIYLVGASPSFLLSNYESAQAKIPFMVNMTYGLGSLTGDDVATASVNIVPEPATLSFFVLTSLAFLRRRRE